jgi:ABC-type phosphate transport system permease subunit/ABC-type phosphate transport system auxiliary subunit
MSVPTLPAPPAADTPPDAKQQRSRRVRQGNSLLSQGEPSIWATGGALAIAIAMIVGLLVLVAMQGFPTFWPKAVIQIRTLDGKTLMGEVVRNETYTPANEVFESLPPQDREKAMQAVKDSGGVARRRMLRLGNFDLTGNREDWVSDFEIAEETQPEWAVVIERVKWGNFYGTPTAFIVDERVVATEPEKIWSAFSSYEKEVHERLERRIYLERTMIGERNVEQESARLAARQAELTYGGGSPEHAVANKNYDDVKDRCKEEIERIKGEISSITKANERLQMRLVAADGKEKTLKMDEIVRAYPANQLTSWEKLGVYGSRWREFLCDRPRESNTEGGVFPCIWGTVALTLLLTLAVVPFGVLAALYLREYAKSGPIISAVRIAINNLAGIPSIVFGVFGYGFFCLLFGAYVDGGPENIRVNPWPAGVWWIALAFAVSVGVAAFFVGVVGSRNTSKDTVVGRHLGTFAIVLWLLSLATIFFLIVKIPYFHGFSQAKLPTPTFGKGGVLWASLTLALLTLPVVIVATEEALAAVPSSMREGSYACGASKWQTIRRIVLPRAMPGIMTGMILAMARGAGEVAPIMLVGAVKFSPELAIDDVFPFLHPDRNFMHLAYHIFDLGFQSPNSEAARPMVYTTTLLLITIVFLLNLTAIWLRSRLRRRYLVSQF